MIKKNKGQLIISSIVILLPILVGLLLWDSLPEQMATHWNVKGETDVWSGKAFAILGLPCVLLIMHWLCVFITSRDPKNKDQNSKVFSMVLWILPITSLVVSGVTYAIALGKDIKANLLLHLLLGLLFLVFGNYMPKCKQNSTIGIKVVWTLRSEENWNKTHRFAGKLWVISGLLLLVTMAMPVESFVYLMLFLIVVTGFAPMLYSYLYYKKQLKAGTATKKEAEMTSVEKKTTKMSVTVATIIVILAAMVLFIGKYEVKLSKTGFTIEAVCWSDASVSYADIDSIEYREQGARGIRTFGYGTPFIVMGECQNEQFGKYTGYTYTSCEACVVLTIDDKILVINGKDEDKTKELYQELSSRFEEIKR